MGMSEMEHHTAETGRQFSHKDKAPSVYQEVIDTAKFCRPGSFGALSGWFGGFKHHIFQWLQLLGGATGVIKKDTSKFQAGKDTKVS